MTTPLVWLAVNRRATLHGKEPTNPHDNLQWELLRIMHKIADHTP